MRPFDFFRRKVALPVRVATSVASREAPFDETRWSPPQRPPERKGKRKTAEEREVERTSLAAHMRELAAKRIARDFARAGSIGVTHYIWQTCGADSCDDCLALAGMKFRLDTRPAHGHAGEPACKDRGYCRCWPEFIIPGFS